MGGYLNPGSHGFESVRAGEYVDKSGLIAQVNATIGTQYKLGCTSRARRFGKSFAAKMLCAYYSRTCDTAYLFDDLEIAQDPSYREHLNKYDVIYVDVTRIIGDAGGIERVVPEIMRRVQADVLEAYPAITRRDTLTDVLANAVEITGTKFFFIIDEWDALFREAKENHAVQDACIDLLRTLFKDSGTTDKVFAGAYMTGILPIKKYGTQSAVSDFREYTMSDPGRFAPYFGFTEDEVRGLCERHGMDFSQMKAWYDGYWFPGVGEVYNPNSVMEAIARGHFGSYWTQTDTYESLRMYIDLDLDGLQQAVFDMLGGGRIKIDTVTFQNDMTSISSRDDVLTLLVHLGYLAYDIQTHEVRIPNEEIRQEFVRTVKMSHREALSRLVKNSDLLLKATCEGEEDMVAAMVAQAHDTGAAPLWYNDEQSLRYVIKFAYITAVDEYLRVEELPGGRGCADIVYLPKRGSRLPLLVVELKWDKPAASAIEQIRERSYPAVLAGYGGEALLVGITYDSKTKEHSCRIERLEL